MTPADRAVLAGYEPSDEEYVATPSFFGIIKGLSAMKHLDSDPRQKAIYLTMLEGRVDELRRAWGM